MWDHRPDSYNVLKVSFKKERKLCTQWLFMKSMLLTRALKASWPSSLVTSEKSNRKSVNKLIRKSLSGEKKEELRLCLVFFSLMKSTCLTLNASHSWTEPLKVIKPQSLSWQQIAESQKLEEQTTSPPTVSPSICLIVLWSSPPNLTTTRKSVRSWKFDAKRKMLSWLRQHRNFSQKLAKNVHCVTQSI